MSYLECPRCGCYGSPTKYDRCDGTCECHQQEQQAAVSISDEELEEAVRMFNERNLRNVLYRGSLRLLLISVLRRLTQGDRAVYVVADCEIGIKLGLLIAEQRARRKR